MLKGKRTEWAELLSIWTVLEFVQTSKTFRLTFELWSTDDFLCLLRCSHLNTSFVFNSLKRWKNESWRKIKRFSRSFVRTIWSKRRWSSSECRVRSTNWFSNCSILSRKFWRKRKTFRNEKFENENEREFEFVFPERKNEFFSLKRNFFFIFDRTCWETDSFSNWIRKVSRCSWTSFNWRSRSRS